MSVALIYGASGYTGELVVAEAERQGLRPIIAGRNPTALASLAGSTGLEQRVFRLDNPATVDRGLDAVTVVLNCAGPFAQTAPALIAACVRRGAHYLDLAGEVPEFETALAHDAAAKAVGSMLMPGVGFGVVPTDCLAAYLKAQLPSATQLTLAFQTQGGVSRGTLLTVIKDLPKAGVVRRDGKLLATMPAASRRSIDFGAGPVATVLNPWRGDISTAWHTTGIANIETYAAFPGPLQLVMRASRWTGWLLGAKPVQNLLSRLLRGQPTGPTAAERSAGWTRVWGEVVDGSGQRVEARLRGPEAYDFSALTAVAVLTQALNGVIKPGFQTPARVYGADFVLTIPGVERS